MLCASLLWWALSGLMVNNPSHFRQKQFAINPWWRHQMETFFASLALCEGNPPVTGGFPSHRRVTRSFDVFFNLCLNKRLSKQSGRWWFQTPSRSLWRHCNASTYNPHWLHPLLNNNVVLNFIICLSMIAISTNCLKDSVTINVFAGQPEIYR